MKNRAENDAEKEEGGGGGRKVEITRSEALQLKPSTFSKTLLQIYNSATYLNMPISIYNLEYRVLSSEGTYIVAEEEDFAQHGGRQPHRNSRVQENGTFPIWSSAFSRVKPLSLTPSVFSID